MSTIAVSYRSMENAASEAKSVARKLDTYAKNLSNQVYQKLNNYGGNHTYNINNAKSAANQKISDLQTKSSAYTTYANDLSDLKERCSSVDKSVKTMVSTLTAEFKANNGIKNSNIQNAINYFLVSLKNSTNVGRWVNNTSAKEDSLKDYIKQRLDVWWDYDGGKQLVKGVLVGALEIAIAVCAIVAVSFSGGVLAVIGGVLAVVSASIALYNGFVNIVNEFRAYNETHNNDNPALGRRRSNENTLQDVLRRETDSQLLHNIATGIDGVKFVCDVGSFLIGIVNLGKNGLKFLKENKTSVKDFLKNLGTNMKKVFSKDFLKNVGLNVKKVFSKEFIQDITISMKQKDWTMFKDFGGRLKEDFLYNFNKSFKNFDSLEDGAKSVKNILGITKDLIKNKDGIKGGMKISLEKIILPCLTVFTVNKDKPKIIGFMGDQLRIDYLNHITAKNFYDIYKNPKNLNSDRKKINTNLFQKNIIDIKVLEKLQKKSSVTCSIPHRYIPKIINIKPIDMRILDFRFKPAYNYNF